MPRGGYHGDYMDPKNKQAQIITREHARQVVEAGGSVMLFNKLYHKDNFDQFPMELEFSQLTPDQAEAARVDIKKRMVELESEMRKLDESQAEAGAEGPGRAGRLSDLLKHGSTAESAQVKGSDEFERWRDQVNRQAADTAKAAETVPPEGKPEEGNFNPITTGDSTAEVVDKLNEKREGKKGR